MSNGKIWYKRNPLDFIHGTMNLSLEEKGAYSLILDLIYSRGGPIADDGRYLAGVCNVSLKKWFSLRDSLVRAGKIFINDGFISNKRAEKELEVMRDTSQKLSESGAKGGQKRAENARNFNENSRNCAENVAKTFETSTKTQDKFAENEFELNKNNDLSQARLKHTRAKNRIDKNTDISSLRSDISYDHFRENQDFDEVKDLGNPPETSPPNSTASPPDEERRTPPPSSAKPPLKAAQKAQFEREFEDIFWPQVVRKLSKVDARKAWAKARGKASLETIMSGFERHQNNLKAKGTELQFWPYPSTFLNGERWTDEPDPVIPQQGKNNHEQRHANARNQGLSKGEEFAEIWRSISEHRQSGEETGEYIPDGFLSQARIDNAREIISGHRDFPCGELAFIQTRA